MPGVAFFDLDKTLIEQNSATLWVRRELREGRLSRWSVMRALGWTFLYELGFARVESAIEEAVSTLAGQSESDMKARVLAFFNQEAKTLVRPGALRAVHRHRDAGDTVALLTSSSSYLGHCFADHVGAGHVLSNQFEVDGQGCFTGVARKPLCYGLGKLHYARELCAQLGLSLEASTFYTDSYSDAPVLEEIGSPVAVHPDPRLRRLALKRGWPIEVWS